ncbi:hypothetical protein [Agrobacterium sp. LMR679]|uniref:hypothetical protein n=1 Tax=Agrobacterium sp. LMR679 TaxID=3014335 RepID=UPI0022AF0607|nr:hypothetical protein [Agrobacterium sp. LMR679]MCZ4072552.1 hypothetical protein [Agrobacterium sp. LMR679]
MKDIRKKIELFFDLLMYSTIDKRFNAAKWISDYINMIMRTALVLFLAQWLRNELKGYQFQSCQEFVGYYAILSVLYIFASIMTIGFLSIPGKLLVRLFIEDADTSGKGYLWHAVGVFIVSLLLIWGMSALVGIVLIATAQSAKP